MDAERTSPESSLNRRS